MNICPNEENKVSETEREITVELPSTLKKIETKLAELRDKLHRNKQEANQLYNEAKAVEKLFERYIVVYTKQSLTSNNPTRTPSGFASPTQVTDALCDFMGREQGSLVSRTEFSKYLFAYIKENKLQSSIKPTVILPDTKLAILLGKEAMLDELTHFSIQKFITPHFIHNKK